ncbi:MAG: hypothetical protein R3C16_01105 [Hyphomonadaceae bacterium]
MINILLAGFLLLAADPQVPTPEGGAATVETAAQPDQAAPDAQASQTAQTGQQPQTEERVICRRVQVVGTHMRQRVCTTASQDQAQHEQSQDDLAGMRRAGGLNEEQ